MIRKKNLYQRPRKLYEKSRIKEENVLIKKYGLKNKKEIWKASAKIDYYRHRAKALAKQSLEEQEVLIRKLKNLGLGVKNTADVLDLEVENILDRTLPTIVTKNKLTNTVKQARQMVAHKKILVDGKAVNSPSYLVPISLENKITIKRKSKAKPKVESPAEVQTEIQIVAQEVQEVVSKGIKQEEKQ